MKFYFDKRVVIGFIITVGVMIVLSIFLYVSMQRLINTSQLLSHATRVINNAEQVVKSIVDVETGQRGYVITGNEEFLEPFNESSKVLDVYLNTLDSLTRTNSDQQQRVDTLRMLITKQLQWSIGVINSRKENFEKAQNLVIGGEGKRTTDAIRTCIKRVQHAEREIYKHGNTITDKSLQRFQYAFVGLTGVIIIIILYLFYTINTAFKARMEVESKLNRVAEETRDLYDNAPCGYHSLDPDGNFVDVNQTELNWLGYTRDDLTHNFGFRNLLTEDGKLTFKNSFQEFKQKGFVHNLEFELVRKDGSVFPVIINSTAVFDGDGEFIKSRSTVFDNTDRKKAENRILNLNQELEGFTYSVSHDLRAPLRSIIGYAQILKEEYFNKLDDEAKRITEVIIRNTVRMGQLIDDLLDFSRLGRKQISYVNINMNELVQNILRELTPQYSKKTLSINVLPMAVARADMSMIRQVWINLISNALKYSAKKDSPVIEIGSFKRDGKNCYYISDNGAGFDMKYVDKLFGVFQRLHKMNEFEGTGVGLALVKTIIKRHEGDAWAEGRINEGAKFYFTLPT